MRLRNILITGALAALMVQPALAQAIGGRYKVQGTNFDGSPYGGEATITLTSATTCEIVWTTGVTSSNGICMRNDNSFAAGYEMGDKIELVIYKLMGDGSLNGLWTIAGQEGNGTEVLIPLQ